MPLVMLLMFSICEASVSTMVPALNNYLRKQLRSTSLQVHQGLNAYVPQVNKLLPLLRSTFT